MESAFNKQIKKGFKGACKECGCKSYGGIYTIVKCPTCKKGICGHCWWIGPKPEELAYCYVDGTKLRPDPA